jgi:hypothetical protein
MSIILEALKKASDRPSAAPKMEDSLSPEVHDTHNLSDFKISRSFALMALVILAVGSVMFFSGALKRDISMKAEGYSAAPAAQAAIEPPRQEKTPISNLITKLSSPRVTLNGIVFGIGKPAAIIENKIVEEGSSVNGMKVVKIYSDKVEMLEETTGKPFTLKVD